MATYYINADTGNDTTGDGSSSLPWKTLSKAYSSALDNDEIICQSSTAHYTWAAITMDKTMTISGETVGGAIFDAGGANGNLWTIRTDIIINKLDFTGLIITSSQRGGFKFDNTNAGNLEFNNCRFYDIEIKSDFAGIFCNRSTTTGHTFPITINASIFYNITGLGSTQSIFGNIAPDWDVYINNCVFDFNAGSGNELGYLNRGYGGTYFHPYIVNTIMVNSQAISVDIYYLGDSSMDYSCTYGNFLKLPTGSNNITADPLFIDSANGNYNLSPNSPCIDAGTLI